MSRRRIVRPPEATSHHPKQQRRLQRLSERLAKEETALERWWRKLHRAAGAIDKLKRSVVRIKRQLAEQGERHGPHR